MYSNVFYGLWITDTNIVYTDPSNDIHHVDLAYNFFSKNIKNSKNYKNNTDISNEILQYAYENGWIRITIDEGDETFYVDFMKDYTNIKELKKLIKIIKSNKMSYTYIIDTYKDNVLQTNSKNIVLKNINCLILNKN